MIPRDERVGWSCAVHAPESSCSLGKQHPFHAVQTIQTLERWSPASAFRTGILSAAGRDVFIR
jgi:hypothetical protein